MRTSSVLNLRHRNATAIGASIVLGLAMFQSLPTSSAAPDDVGLFQLDENVADGGAGDDWANIFAGTDSAFVDTGIIPDPAPASIYTGGSSKDDLDIPGWLHKDGSVPDKDDITNGYAAAYSFNDDTYVYFGMDRLSTLGSSFVGTWLLQDESFGVVPGNPPGSTSGFTGQHVARVEDNPATPEDESSPGDVLVLSEFDQGGDGITIKVFEWVGSGGDEGGGTLDTIFGGADGLPADCDSTGSSAPVCAQANHAAIPDAQIPWDYQGKKVKGVVQRDIPVAAFFEGGINLDALFGEAPCFSDIVIETRSSFETNAVLKDFVASSFELCGAEVSIAPDAVNEVGDEHTWTVTANQTNAGSATPAADGTTLTVELTDANGDPITPSEDTCADPGTTGGTCTVTFSSNTPGIITGHVEGNVVIGDTPIPVSTGGVGENPDATKYYVDGRISIAEDDTNGIGEPHTFTVTVEADNGSGSGFAPVTSGNVDVGLTDAGGAASGTPTGSCTENQPSGDNLDASGQCTITFNSDTAGTVTAHATATFDVGIDLNGDGDTADPGELVTLTRSTDGDDDFGSVNSDDAVKTYVDGTLRWLKTDDQGTPLGGASFWVCRTHSYDSSDGSFDAIVDTNPGPGKDADSRCVVVVDNGALDDDPDAGELQLDDVVLGRYTVQEKEPPVGYAVDPDEVTRDVAIDDENTGSDESLGDFGTFVDPALFKVIILTCNTSTEKLVVSETDEDPGTVGGKKDTQAAGSLSDADQAYLCGLESNYDNKTRGTHDYRVTIPKP